MPLSQNQQEFTEQNPRYMRTDLPRDMRQRRAAVVEVDLRMVCSTAPSFQPASEQGGCRPDTCSLATRMVQGFAMVPSEETLLASSVDAVRGNEIFREC